MKTREALDDYDRAAEILKAALLEMREARISDYGLPPLLADFALMIAVALAGSSGAEALMAGMRSELLAAERGDRGAEVQRRAKRLSQTK